MRCTVGQGPKKKEPKQSKEKKKILLNRILVHFCQLLIAYVGLSTENPSGLQITDSGGLVRAFSIFCRIQVRFIYFS